MIKFTFSGHDTFHCRHFWLKKGYDFLNEGKKFSDEMSVVDLGVGKNMVSAIRHWLRAFGIVDDKDIISDFGHFIFSENGKDPYLEDIGTLWLLQYKILVVNYASIFSIVFNEYRKEKIEISKALLLKYLVSYTKQNPVSENTLDSDITAFLRNYTVIKSAASSIEDDYSGLLHDLNLIQKIDDKGTYAINSSNRTDFPVEILVFAILDRYQNETSISFENLLKDSNSPALAFALNHEGLYNKLIEASDKYQFITFTDDAGIRELQFHSSQIDKWQLLEQYYAL